MYVYVLCASCVCMCVYVYVSVMCVSCVCVCMRVCICVCVCMYVCVCMCVQPTVVGPTGGSKDKAAVSVSFDHLAACLDAIGTRAETLIKITAQYPAYQVCV